MGWTVPPHLFTAQMLPSDYNLVGLLTDALHRRHFADKELKQNFMMCSEFKTGNLTTAYSVLLNVSKGVLKMKETLWKNSLTTAKDI
jgi:hypothetical protein